MQEQRALIVEDHPQITYTVRPLLTELGLVVDAVSSLKSAEQKIENIQYDLIVLDRSLPDGDSLDLLDLIESYSNDTKVLVLSSVSTADQRTRGLQLGADDYVVKPFHLPELRARCIRLLSRSKRLQSSRVYIAHLLSYDSAQKVLFWKKKKRRFTHREAELFELFLRNIRHTITNEYLLNHLWTIEKTPTLAALHVRVRRLRAELKTVPLEILSVYGVGYALRYVR